MESPLQFSYPPRAQKNRCTIENDKRYIQLVILPKKITICFIQYKLKKRR